MVAEIKIPAQLPTTKAALTALCRRHGLEVAGSILQLTKRLTSARDDNDSESQAESEDDIGKMTRTELRSLAGKLKLDVTGTKDELISRAC